MKVTKKTNILVLTQKHPETASILTKDYGLHCIGCMGAMFETLEQGAKAHGLKNKQIEELIAKLNKSIKAKTGPQKKIKSS